MGVTVGKDVAALQGLYSCCWTASSDRISTVDCSFSWLCLWQISSILLLLPLSIYTAHHSQAWQDKVKGHKPLYITQFERVAVWLETSAVRKTDYCTPCETSAG